MPMWIIYIYTCYTQILKIHGHQCRLWENVFKTSAHLDGVIVQGSGILKVHVLGIQMCQGRFPLPILAMVIPTFIGNPSLGYINPYYWVDDHPLLCGNNASTNDFAELSKWKKHPRRRPHVPLKVGRLQTTTSFRGSNCHILAGGFS